MYEHDHDVVTQEEVALKQPPLYAIIMHNDHYTTMDFVVFVLMDVFMYQLPQAIETMMKIHEHGQAVVATFPKEIAETKVGLVEALADEQEFPLQLTLQKCD